jgi:hypothetical protein
VKKAFKPTCAWIKKEQAAHRRALSAWYRLGTAVGDPWAAPMAMISSPAAKKARTKHDDLVLYAAALGQKQKKLPVNLSGWTGKAWWAGDAGRVTFSQNTVQADAVTIPVRFLEWTPAPAAAMQEAA